MVTEFPLDQLISKIRLIKDLQEKLVYVGWGREAFVLLGWMARDIAQIVRQQAGYEETAELAAKLEQQVNTCLSAESLPQGRDRERLLTLLDSLTHSIPHTGATAAPPPQKHPSGTAGEVLLVTIEDAWRLGPELRSAGFRVRQVTRLADARAALVRPLPSAAVIDMDFPGQTLSAPELIIRLRSEGELNLPIFFISERGDLTARLQAVQAGAAGYFTKPLDTPRLLQEIKDRVLHPPARGQRVLIVAETLADAQAIAAALISQNLEAEIVSQPLRVLQALHRFQPHLLLLDLDLIQVNGMELVQAIRQHQEFESLPLILLSSQHDLKRHLAALGAGGDELLGKPLAADYLLAAVLYRLRRAEVLRRKIHNLDHKDTISGLHNRRYFLDQLTRVLAADIKRPVAVMLIGLDNLHKLECVDVAAADEVLEQAAKRLSTALAAGYQTARFGAGVFAVLINDADHETVLTLARAVRTALEQQVYPAGESTLALQVSIGISLTDGAEGDPALLIQQADVACNTAREAAGERIHIHHPQADQALALSYQRRLLAEIEEAAQQQRMNLVFQPIVSLRGDRSERYEALLRMRNPEGRELLPEAVFGAVQEHALGVTLDRWVIAQSIRLLRERYGQERATILFINISPAILQDAALAGWLQHILIQAGVPAKALVFEITEATAARHLADLQRFLAAVKALGCGFSLERFGNREHSQALLRDLPVDYVKLDAHFVHNLANDLAKQERLTRLAGELAAAGMTTVVGGIEDSPTLAVLCSCGVDFVQGFFLQRPHKEMSYDFASGVF